MVNSVRSYEWLGLFVTEPEKSFNGHYSNDRQAFSNYKQHLGVIMFVRLIDLWKWADLPMDKSLAGTGVPVEVL